MHHLGISGYQKIAAKLMEGRRLLQSAIVRIPELHVVGEPCMNIISYSSHHNQPDIFVVGDYLKKEGWLVDRQQDPDCIHLTILPTNVPVIPKYIDDLKEAVEYAKNNPRAPGEGNAALYGMMARIPFRRMVKKNVRHIFEEMYSQQIKVKSRLKPYRTFRNGWAK